MASLSRNSLLVVLSLCLLITFSNVAEIHGAKLRPSECKPRCNYNYRCSATSHKKPCMFFCLKCCATCLCVPGNKETCPCYNNWKTKEGRPKCP
eukprot:XP_006383339.2 protein RSI-1 [Populus trichocarpa]